jgi:O-antigen ligase
LQVLSLASAIVFSIGFFENPRLGRSHSLHKLVLWTIVSYAMVAYASLVIVRLLPGVAYETLFAGSDVRDELRFRGLFSSPGVMGAAAGLLVGLAAIGPKKWFWKLTSMAPGLVCVALTQSRSFWLATMVAGTVTAWLYYGPLRKWIYVGLGLSVVVVAVVVALNVAVNTSGVQSFARLDSISDLTGRTELWQSAYKGWQEKPLLGYGFTLGGMGLSGDQAQNQDLDPTQFSRRTLHNGYIQSLMDSGFAGFFLYVATILVSIARVLRFDRRREYPEVLYVLLFLSIANLGESVIYSGSVFQSISFWIFAVFALGLESYDHKMRGTTSAESVPSCIASQHPNLLQ